MFQGMARGVVGDVVFTRQNGQQVSRVRNRVPSNPKTNAQLYQRAIMATIMQAYSAGKAIFDHSFEGYKVGTGCQQRFMKLNTKLLRSAVAADVNAGLIGGACAARVIGPGVVYPVPWTYQISEGSLTQNIMGPSGYLLHFTDIPNETVAEYFQRMGIRQDDIFTVVAFNCATNSNRADVVFSASAEADEFGEQTKCVFLFARLRVKPEVFSNANPISNQTLMSDLFYYDLESNYTPSLETKRINQSILQNDELPESETLYTCGVIRSRDNQDLRSTCVMSWVDNTAKDYGLSTNYLLEGWAQGTTRVGDSNLILEGGLIQRAPASANRMITVTPKSGAPATIYGIETSDETTTDAAKVVKLVATDGRKFYLMGNGNYALTLGNVLAYRGSEYGWDTVVDGVPADDSTVVNYFAADTDRAPIGEIAEFLLQQGVDSMAVFGGTVFNAE